MKRVCVLACAMALCACAQVASDRPLSISAEARCVEFTRLANDMTTTTYRRATAQEALRAQRCPGYR